jgi:hypothetical protein
MDALKANKNKLVSTESWLRSLAYCRCENEFKKVGKAFCDGLNIPKCKILFSDEPYNQIMTFFKRWGIIIFSVSPSHYDGYWFVKLEPG